MKLFHRTEKQVEEPVEEVELIEEEPQDMIRKIEVRDIKQYLVDEYDRVNSLELDIKHLKAKVEDGEVVQAKYDAALVTLDQYNIRIAKLSEDKRELEAKLEEQKKLTKQERERCNDLKIQMHRMEPAQAKEEMREACINAVLKMKGRLAKSRVEQVLMEVPCGDKTVVKISEELIEID